MVKQRNGADDMREEDKRRRECTKFQDRKKQLKTRTKKGRDKKKTRANGERLPSSKSFCESTE